MRVARSYRTTIWVLLGICLASTGCHHLDTPPLPAEAPRENHKINIGDYVINPPDELFIDLVRGVPLPPYKIKPLDELFIQAQGTPEAEPIRGVFQVAPEGTVRFGPTYGAVTVADLTIDEAAKAIEAQLKKSGLTEPKVSVNLDRTRGILQVRGPHLVRPDGTVNLGLYGRVKVAGLTQEAAKDAIEEHLAQYFLNPTVSIDIFGFNSSVYYVIFDGGGTGEQVLRFPYTGSETVLDAIGQVNGLPAVASKSRIWLARPYEGHAEDDILPIDWVAITARGRPETNYQILPRDRIYVAAQPIIRMDTMLARILSPVERVLGLGLLGSSAVHSITIPLGQFSAFGGIGR